MIVEMRSRNLKSDEHCACLRWLTGSGGDFCCVWPEFDLFSACARSPPRSLAHRRVGWRAGRNVDFAPEPKGHVTRRDARGVIFVRVVFVVYSAAAAASVSAALRSS